jgi:predicted nicotinamide N-methyase
MISRTVPITSHWNITVWEWEKPAAIIESYWDAHGRMLGSLGSGTSINPTNSGGGGDGNRLLDPFGLVTWPGAIVAAQELLRIQEQQRQPSRTMLENQTVLVLGAGVGVEAQAAALLGAKRVIATDIHPTTLKLLDYGVQQEAAITNKNAIEPRILDLFSMHDHPLPQCDVLLCADILYNDQLASQVARRCAEALTNNPRLKILITDSQRFVDHFATELNERLLPIRAQQQQQESRCDTDHDGDVPPPPLLAWEVRKLDKFRGSGVAIDEDQTYDVDARLIRMGF